MKGLNTDTMLLGNILRKWRNVVLCEKLERYAISREMGNKLSCSQFNIYLTYKLYLIHLYCESVV